MSKTTYVVGTCFVGLCMVGTLFCLIMVRLGHMGLPDDRQTSLQGLQEMLLVGGIFWATWTVAYKALKSKASPKPDDNASQ